ncbi:alpha-hydroxy-acid oxidizing protein [Saccharopolyspora karakumensis]|uniref:alpha-hydroxy-acid oxidizing protein n=1 Tax=Saccharopolyspora karakumensis TaxID=2530386 RepID=UPI001A9D18ED|nr:alpha-hydroxy-acid oxidizing protein [Saccharopolyspora karakumensis]
MAVAQQRARERLQARVYSALAPAPSAVRRSRTSPAAFAELELAPHVADHQPVRAMRTTVIGQYISLPVPIRPTGVQGVHPDREVAVARAEASRGTVAITSEPLIRFASLERSGWVDSWVAARRQQEFLIQGRGWTIYPAP